MFVTSSRIGGTFSIEVLLRDRLVIILDVLTYTRVATL